MQRLERQNHEFFYLGTVLLTLCFATWVELSSAGSPSIVGPAEWNHGDLNPRPNPAPQSCDMSPEKGTLAACKADETQWFSNLIQESIHNEGRLTTNESAERRVYAQ